VRPVSEWDESDLLALVRDEVQESLSLEYKKSAALSKNDTEKNNMSKDISAFANSEGGIIIYGMRENGHIPKAIDTGVDRTKLTKEWLESVVRSHIHPNLDPLLIKQIALPSKGPDMVAYALEIGQATSRAPHQANDHRYYKRFNFESTPMEDYEVRDLMRRSIEYGKKYGAAWDLNLEVERLIVSINERGQLDGSAWIKRDSLRIAVSNALRSAGNAIVLLPKPVREDVATLIKSVDTYNAIIETVDPGQRDMARLSEPRKNELAEMMQIGFRISRALTAILNSEP
jgi:Putative DNA-binding domain